MKFYITDTTDPIAMGYRNMYSNLFEDLDAKISDSIEKNFVYPEFLYKVQASMLEEYHNTKSEVLFRGDDSWKKASYITTTQSNKTINNTLDAYYTMVKENEDEEVGLIQMYTPREKQSLTAYLTGTVIEGKNKLKIYKLSSDESILGLTQLDNQITLDKKIQKNIDELNVTGAKVTKNMMIVPINNSLLYIEQIYQTKTNEANIPLLKMVIVASGNKVAVGKNIGFLVPCLIFSLYNVAFMGYIAMSSYIYVDFFGLSEQMYSYFFAANAALSLIGPMIYVRFLSDANKKNFAYAFLNSSEASHSSVATNLVAI